MFSIFKRKANTGVLQEATVKEKQNVNVASLLVIAMTEYLKDAEQKPCMAVPVITDIRKQYERLLSLGMGTTQNAIRLKQYIDEALSEGIDDALELITIKTE